MRAGRPSNRFRSERPDARARWALASRVTCSPEIRPALIGFCRLLVFVLGCPPGDASPVLRVPRASSPRPRLRFGVIARDRPVAPKQSAEPRHYERTRFVTRPARPTRSHRAGTKCLGVAAVRLMSGASLEVFVPFSARWPCSRCPGRPASGRSRFGVPVCIGRARNAANLPDVTRRPCGFTL
jgi:hypothetical protein